MKWLLALNLSSKSTNFSRSTIMWLVAPESNSRFGVVLPLVLNSCSLKVNAKLCELVMFSSFSADFFAASLAGFSFLQSLVLWEEFLHL